ncbi:ABC transporter ATP-binding protein [Hathewaya histolytica]|uniref:ABC transporter ATP-binding protein n=1 Tax=Hathewaya histolytica TaxID=1498 RepID=UPI003B680005
MEVINIENVTFNYPECSESAIKDINLKVNEGELVLIVGPSGCGKSTLIRLINRLVPSYCGGTIIGNVYLKGKNIEDMAPLEIVKQVGMVYQHPEKQIILQDIEREIAFGLENLNTDIDSMKRNVAEVISLLGLNDIKNKQTDEVSGGQKQRIAIASVLSMDPDIILFDEPISQLDPIGAEEVLNSIKKLNAEMGKTVILVEQRLDKCFSMADRIIFMEEGNIIGEGKPRNIPENINKKYHLPSLTYLFKSSGRKDHPVDLKEARQSIEGIKIDKLNSSNTLSSKEPIMEVKKLKFSYSKGEEILKDISFNLNRGEVLTVMGENGAGKSTLFKIITGLMEGYKGNIYIKGKNIRKMKEEKLKYVGYLSQNPNDYFGRENVFEEVGYTLKNIGEYNKDKIEEVLHLLNINHLRNKNPRDLSGGEKQRVAIACTLVTDPEILILDEPTRGMDSLAKENLGDIINTLKNKGKSIVLVTHDTNFSGDYSDRVMLLFHGQIIAIGNAEHILCESIYYSPQVSRLFKNKCKVIKSEEALNILKVNKYE